MTKIKTRFVALLVTVVGLLGLSLLTPGVAQAGTIYCGNAQVLFMNRTPHSRIDIWHPAVCGYNNIITVPGDNVYLDYPGGGYMTESPRTACAVYINGQYSQWYNTSYSNNKYFWLSQPVYKVTDCWNF